MRLLICAIDWWLGIEYSHYQLQQFIWSNIVKNGVRQELK